jgi:sugar O-acyltransferase (sialic acid O-acetyltransferase NeuD family)
MIKLAILGFGGHGRVVADIANESGWKNINFYDDDKNLKNKVAGSQEDFFKKALSYDGVFVAIGQNYYRKQIILKLKKIGANIVNIIHPSVYVGSRVSVGVGVVAMPRVVINTSCIIGDGVILNTACTIDHDCEIGRFSHISPGVNIAGNVKIGCNTWIGINASIKNNISLGSNIKVGSGSAVVSDISDNLTVVGIPAISIK